MEGNRTHKRWPLILVLGLCVAVATAELADVYLKNGLRLRGDVEQTADEIVIRNAAGELRVPRADVERIEPVDKPAEQPAPKPAVEPDAPESPPSEPA